MLALELSRYVPGDTVKLGLLRGTDSLSVDVTVQERPHPMDELVGLADPEKSSVPKLGILGVDHRLDGGGRLLFVTCEFY